MCREPEKRSCAPDQIEILDGNSRMEVIQRSATGQVEPTPCIVTERAEFDFECTAKEIKKT
jgi:hypothetical protein